MGGVFYVGSKSSWAKVQSVADACMWVNVKFCWLNYWDMSVNIFVWIKFDLKNSLNCFFFHFLFCFKEKMIWKICAAISKNWAEKGESGRKEEGFSWTEKSCLNLRLDRVSRIFVSFLGSFSLSGLRQEFFSQFAMKSLEFAFHKLGFALMSNSVTFSKCSFETHHDSTNGLSVLKHIYKSSFSSFLAYFAKFDYVFYAFFRVFLVAS